MFLLFFADILGIEQETVSLISNILLGITAALAVISGVKYIIDGKKVIDFSK